MRRLDSYIGFVWAGVLIIVALIAIVAGTSLPTGVPGEWEWQRVDWNTTWLNVESLTLFLGMTALMAVAAAMADWKIRRRSLAVLALAAISSASVIANSCILSMGRVGTVESVWGVLDQWTTGYYNEAVRIDGLATYLRNFQRIINKSQIESDNNDTPGKRVRHSKEAAQLYTSHLEVHPPGNVVVSYFAYHLAGWEPAKRVLMAVAPGDVATAAQSPDLFGGTEYDDYNQAFWGAWALCLLFLISISAANLLVVLAVAYLNGGFQNSGLALFLLSAIPGPILFLGHYDTFFYFLGSVCVSIFLAAFLQDTPETWILFLLGISMAAGVVMTLGFGMLLAVFVSAFLLAEWRGGHAFRPLIWIAAGGLAVVALLEICGIRIVEICLTCLQNNGRFFVESHRHSIWWCVMNWIDYAAFIGVFPALLLLENLLSNWSWPPRSKIGILSIAFLAVLSLFLFTSFSRGEAGRLMLCAYPVNMAVFAMVLSHARVKKRPRWMALLFCGFAMSVLCLTLRLTLKLILID